MRRYPRFSALARPRSSSYAILSACLLSALCGTVVAESAPSPVAGITAATASKLVDQFLSVETGAYPGQVSYSIGQISGLNSLGQCLRAEVRQSPGARLYGRTRVSLQCVDGNRWVVSVPVQIKVVAPVIVARKNLASGQVLTETDVVTQEADLGELPPGVITETDRAVGQVARMTVPAGKALRSDMLRTQSLITAGQSIKITTRGPGFEVSNDGTALNSAGLGDLVKARLASGQVVSGKATADGRIEIAF